MKRPQLHFAYFDAVNERKFVLAGPIAAGHDRSNFRQSKKQHFEKSQGALVVVVPLASKPAPRVDDNGCIRGVP